MSQRRQQADPREWDIGEVSGGDPRHPCVINVTRHVCGSREAEALHLAEGIHVTSSDGVQVPTGYVGIGLHDDGEFVYIHMTEAEAMRLQDKITEALESLRTWTVGANTPRPQNYEGPSWFDHHERRDGNGHEHTDE